MSDAAAGSSGPSAAGSILDVVQDVVSSDVAAYGIGWPEKVPPPDTWIPDDGWTLIPDGGWTVDIPGTGLINVAALTTWLTSRPGLWIALALVALFVAGGAIALETRSTSPVSLASAPGIATATSSAPAGCAQPPAVAPIVAVFNQPTFSTTYQTVVSGGGQCAPTLQWGGPNCGNWTPQQPQTAAGTQTTAIMVWQHPHPPCDPTTDHADVTVTMTVSYSGGALKCSYQGAASGTGSACVRQ